MLQVAGLRSACTSTLSLPSDKGDEKNDGRGAIPTPDEEISSSRTTATPKEREAEKKRTKKIDINYTLHLRDNEWPPRCLYLESRTKKMKSLKNGVCLKRQVHTGGKIEDGDILVRVNDGRVIPEHSWFHFPRTKRRRRQRAQSPGKPKNPMSVKLTFQRKVQVTLPRNRKGTPDEYSKIERNTNSQNQGLISNYDGDGSRFAFSISLFDTGELQKDTFQYYKESAIDFVRKCLHKFPDCLIYLHINSLVTEATLARFEVLFEDKEKLKVFQYACSVNKPGSCWLINAMRYRILWEHDGDETVCVCDIHDDFNFMTRQIQHMSSYLEQTKKEIAVTYWESDDEECLSSISLPLNGHFHIDGGICLWKAGEARQKAQSHGSFVEYCSSMVSDLSCIPRGIDEMFVDAFLGQANVYEGFALYLPHKHRIRSKAPEYFMNIDYSKMDMKKLKNVCSKTNLKISGRKEELIERIKERKWRLSLKTYRRLELISKCRILGISCNGSRNELISRLALPEFREKLNCPKKFTLLKKDILLEIGSKTSKRVSKGDLMYVCHEKEKYSFNRQNESFMSKFIEESEGSQAESSSTVEISSCNG